MVLSELLAALPASPTLRQEALAVAKKYMAEERTIIEYKLNQTGDGRACAAALSLLTDEIITALFQFITTRLYPNSSFSEAEKIALVATGGYGRGLMAPHSDVDLLFLLPYKQTAFGEQVAESILYFLWDLRLKVGHATRSIDECMKQAKGDTTIRTSLLESRLIWGDKALFTEFKARFKQEVLHDTASLFITEKLKERDERHLKNGGSRYLVEPNIKESKGGLRDLHTLFWLTKYAYALENIDELVGLGILEREELIRFQKAESFLWTVRCHLHFLARRGEERLSFDYQKEISRLLRYKSHPGQLDVERFMKHYFHIAKQVGDLSAIVCAGLEEIHEKPKPLLSRVMSRMTNRSVTEGDFLVENNRITIAHNGVFKENPLNLLKIFLLSQERGLEIHPASLHQISRDAKLVNADLRGNSEANKLFRAILTSSKNPENTLRTMNETGIIGRFFLDFGKIVALMQFSMYHSYTVDEHLLRAIGILAEIEKGENPAYTLAHSLMSSLTKEERDVLYAAIFFHDIAKGRPEDHSIAGARVALLEAPRMGFNVSETETIAWLVEQHLIMSTLSQTRDLNDRKTIETFAAIVQRKERMKLLTILTTADIAAVGPTVWNGWKSQLLSTLYFETEPMITGGVVGLERGERVLNAQNELREALKWEDAKFDTYIARHYPYYWLKNDLETLKYHADFLSSGNEAKISARFDKAGGITHLTFLCPDHPRLLSIATGACATAGANIYGASIYTTTDGYALDTLSINRGFDADSDEQRRAERVSTLIIKALKGEVIMKDSVALMNEKALLAKTSKAFTIEPIVTIDNTWSHRHTMIEVTGLDRPGLLQELTSALSSLNLNIASAHIVTYGEKAVDVFYVTDLTGGKLLHEGRLKTVRTTLLKVLESV